MVLIDNAKLMQAQKVVYDFISGQIKFDDFNLKMSFIFDDIGNLFNETISNFSQTKILESAEKYAQSLACRNAVVFN